MTSQIVSVEEGSTALTVPQVNANYFGAILEGTERTVELLRTIEASVKASVKQRAEEVLEGAAEVRRRGGKQVYYFDYGIMFGNKGKELLAQILEARGPEYSSVKRICDMVLFHEKESEIKYWPGRFLENYSASLEGLERVVSGIDTIRERNWEFMSSYLVVIPNRDSGKRHIRANIPVTERRSLYFLFAGFSSEHVVPFDFQYDEQWEENKDRFAAALAGLDERQTKALIGIVLGAYNEWGDAVIRVAEPFSELLGYEPRAPEEIEAQMSILNSCMTGLRDGAPIEKVRYLFRIEKALDILEKALKKTIVEPVNDKLRILPVMDAQDSPYIPDVLELAGFTIHYRKGLFGLGMENKNLGIAYAEKPIK